MSMVSVFSVFLFNLKIDCTNTTNSSSKEIFDEEKPMYQDALKKAGHKHVLKYEKINVSTPNKKKMKGERYKRIFYCLHHLR